MSANRIVLASLIISAYTFLTAAELWHERRKSLIRRWPALFVPALHGAVFLFPIPLASMLPKSAASPRWRAAGSPCSCSRCCSTRSAPPLSCW